MLVRAVDGEADTAGAQASARIAGSRSTALETWRTIGMGLGRGQTLVA
jgi:hypothetical protein